MATLCAKHDKNDRRQHKYINISLNNNRLDSGMHFALLEGSYLEEFKMKKFFILMLFALNLVYFNHAMALSNTDQTVIFNDEGKPDGEKDGEKNPEDDCE